MKLHRPDPPQFDPPYMQVEFIPTEDERSPWVAMRMHKFNNGFFKLIVPAGFRCDLASVPGWLLWLFGPNGKHQRAALFHDAAYRLQPKNCAREDADSAFRAIMRTDGVPWLRRTLIYVAVRAWGWKAWNANKRELESL